MIRTRFEERPQVRRPEAEERLHGLAQADAGAGSEFAAGRRRRLGLRQRGGTLVRRDGLHGRGEGFGDPPSVAPHGALRGRVELGEPGDLAGHPRHLASPGAWRGRRRVGGEESCDRGPAEPAVSAWRRERPDLAGIAPAPQRRRETPMSADASWMLIQLRAGRHPRAGRVTVSPRLRHGDVRVPLPGDGRDRWGTGSGSCPRPWSA